MIKILMFPQYSYPCDHVMLESVYSKILPEKYFEIHWVMKNRNNSGIGKTVSWNGTKVFLIDDFGGSIFRNVFGSLLTVLEVIKLSPRFKKSEYDIIQVRNDIVNCLIGLYLSNRLGAKFVYQVSSPDAEFRLRYVKERSIDHIFYNFLRGKLELHLRRFICRKADMVLAVSDAMREYMISQEGIPPEKVFAFPLGFDSTTVPSDLEISSLRERYRLQDKKVIIYFGTMAKIRKLDMLVPIMINIKRIFPNVILLLVGEGEKSQDVENLESLFSKNDLNNNVLFVGKVKRPEVPMFIKLASLSISIIPPIFEYVVSSPMKAVESIGLGVPVVCNKGIPDQDYVVRESHGGLITEYDVQSLSKSIIDLLEDDAVRLGMGEVGAEWVRRNRSYTAIADYVASLYSNLLATKTPG